MQIVIDIPENEYRYIKEIYENNDIVESTYSYIYHGTPLPKGHGRLIDADAINWFKGEDEEGNPCYILDKRDLNLEPTIIEADGGGEDVDSN